MADLPDDHAGLQRPRGGRRAAVLGQHRALPGHDDGPGRATCGRCCCTRWSGSTAGSRRSRAPSASCRPTWSSWPWASPAPSARAWSTPRRRGRRARQRRPGRPVHVHRARRLRGRRHRPRAVADRVGDRRGPGRRGRRGHLADRRLRCCRARSPRRRSRCADDSVPATTNPWPAPGRSGDRCHPTSVQGHVPPRQDRLHPRVPRPAPRSRSPPSSRPGWTSPG